jgi:YVTN family beta-propeller protein
MSVVYQAEDLRLKRKVALKLLAPELAEDQRFRDRFLRESELAASLDHPNIVPIYAAGEADGQLYIAMRYVPGGDLKRLLRDGLEPDRACGLLAQVASALDAAHARGLVHRDVKPGNVLLDSGEHCYLCDFGLTKQVSSESGFTATGQIVGTIEYVAPEVIEGKELTAGADLYSLGCLLYECLAGEPPFHRDSEFAVLWAHVNEPPPKLSELRPELSGGLDAVLAKALAKAPEKRYGSGRELVDAARAALPPPAAAPRSRRRLLLAAAGLAAAAAATAVPLILLSGGPHGPSTKPTLAVTTDSIQRIDAKTNKLAATIAVPVGGFLLAAGGGSLWAANTNENRLFRIDPKRNRVAQTIQTIHPAALSFGAGSLWVLDTSDGIVSQFDPSTGAASATIPLPPGTAPGPPTVMRAADEGVWVQWAGNVGNAVRIDPGSTAAREVTIGSPQTYVLDFAAVGPVLWTLAPDPKRSAYNLVRIDLRNPRAPPTATHVTVDYGFLAADTRGVWLTNPGRDRVLHINARTRRLDRIVGVGISPLSIAEGENAVWVVNFEDGTVSRIDPATDRVVATIPVGPNPAGIAVVEGSVWVDVHPR